MRRSLFYLLCFCGAATHPRCHVLGGGRGQLRARRRGCARARGRGACAHRRSTCDLPLARGAQRRGFAERRSPWLSPALSAAALPTVSLSSPLRPRRRRLGEAVGHFLHVEARGGARRVEGRRRRRRHPDEPGVCEAARGARALASVSPRAGSAQPTAMPCPCATATSPHAGCALLRGRGAAVGALRVRVWRRSRLRLGYVSSAPRYHAPRFHAPRSPRARSPPRSNKGKDLIIAYTVKHTQDLDCGGSYVKLLPKVRPRRHALLRGVLWRAPPRAATRAEPLFAPAPHGRASTARRLAASRRTRSCSGRTSAATRRARRT